jgi:hypothetical protein
MKENNLIALSLIYYDTQKKKYKQSPQLNAKQNFAHSFTTKFDVFFFFKKSLRNLMQNT